MAKAKKEVKDQPVEQVLWAAADKLRKNMDAAEYKHIVLGLIFLVFIAIFTAISPSTRLTFYIGAPFIVAYFVVGFIVYKMGKIIPVDYGPYLKENIESDKGNVKN